jgi:hypothetical protein
MHLSVNMGPTSYFICLYHIHQNIHMQVGIASVFLNEVILYDKRAK